MFTIQISCYSICLHGNSLFLLFITQDQNDHLKFPLKFIFCIKKIVIDVHNIKKNSPLIPALFPTYKTQNEMIVDEGRIPTTAPKKLDSPNLAITPTASIACNESYCQKI